MNLPTSQRIDVGFILIGDFAEVVNGKLYLQGGGWDTLTVTTALPHTRSLGIAVGIEVPWEDTNRRYAMKLTLVNDDTRAELVRVDGLLETGRPPGLPAGQSQLVLMAVNAIVTFPTAGQYLVAASIDDEELKRRPLRVVQPAGIMPPPAAGGRS